MSLRNWPAALILAVALAAGCDTGALPNSGPVHGDTAAVAAAPMAPDYSARRLGAAETMSLQDLRGKPVLLNSWATWCAECRTELPAIQRLAETYRDRGLQVIGVNVDEGGDAGPIAFAAHRGLTFPMVHDEHTRYQAAFRAVGVPQSELISASGRLLKVWQGVFDPTDPDNVALIDAQFPARPSSGPSPGPGPR
ncbi:MAG TPA: TlpA disulfide reductase family protein [Pseudonocardiaceae bacterium]|nr:TlpA disulfide reductase family protein [Pseudonocardiaceae bacterium]